MRRNRNFDRPGYLAQVIDLLAEEFGWDRTTRAACRAHLDVYRSGFDPTLEFICDSPASASWRLKANPDAGPWALRIASYRRSPDPRADELTRRLAEALKPRL